ncbi:MAG: S1/P1 nuclease [Gammaproteobacteria bacterium]
MPSREILLFLATLFVFEGASAYGPAGHRVAGVIAESHLCPAALLAIDRFGEGDRVGDLGSWADQIRSTERWRESAPWHYMNIADHTSLDDYRTPPEGDILWAIERFRTRLADTALSHRDRADALKFLIHFVVDLHQPLHVGRVEDLGGNMIDIVVSGESVDLHRYWDSAVIRDELPVSDYLRRSAALIRLMEENLADTTPRDWAVESQTLRRFVYEFDTVTGSIDSHYEAVARDVTRIRLIQAGLRLAGELNALFCVATEELLRP